MSKRNNLRTLKVLKAALHAGVSYLTIGIMTVQPLYAAGALPTGASVAAGDVAVSSTATSMEVTQTSAAGIVNWSSFSIGEGNTVQFNNGTGATLNRVTGDTISSIEGTLSATGSVYLINQNGIIVGENGVINVGGSFVGSTLDVLDDDFLNGGDTTFAGSSKAAVVNYGKIGALGGDVVLIAAKVDNEGSIDAQAGTAALVAGYEVLMRDASVADGKFVVKVGGTDTEARNSGGIKAADAELRAVDGNVYALAGNTGGYINATGVASSDGRVFLTAEGGTVSVDGSVSAQKADSTGGTIVATGNAVEVGATAKINADGTTGGTILLGGDQYGSQDVSRKLVDFDVANASTTVVYDGAEISANGTNGNGGNIVLWSNDYTYLGSSAVSATGAGAGNGGFAEVSSKGVLDFQGFVDLGAANGTAGTLLLDPFNLTISNGNDSGHTTGPNYTSNGNNSVLNVTTLTNQLTNSDVIVKTGTGTGPGSNGAGDITVVNAITWTSNNNLTLDAINNININAAISNTTSTTAGLNLKANGSISQTAAISVANLDIQAHSSNWAPTVILTNAGNSVTTLTGGGNGNGQGLGNFSFTNNKSLTIGARGLFSNGDVVVIANGATSDITLASGPQDGINTTGHYSDITLVAGRNFINKAGSDGLSTDQGHHHDGRWLVYAGSSVGNTYGGLDSGNQAIWGKSYGDPISGYNGNRYIFADNSGTLSVTLHPLSKVYGTTYTFSSGDIASASLNTSHAAVANAYLATTGSTTNLTSGQIALSSTGAGATADVGSYAVNATYNGYSTTIANGLSVTKATLTVTALSTGKTYGQTVTFNGTEFTTDGLQNGETIGSVTLASDGAAATAGVAGSPYAIMASAATGGTFDAGNYDISYVDGSLTVGQRAITVTADNVSKLLGSFDPALTYSVTNGNLVNGDTFSGTLVRDAGELPGDYAVTQGTVALSSNYDLTFVDGIFTIDPLTQTPGTTTEGGTSPQSQSTVTTQGGGNGAGNGGDVTGSIVANACREDEKIDKVCVRRPYPSNWQPVDGIRFIPASF